MLNTDEAGAGHSHTQHGKKEKKKKESLLDEVGRKVTKKRDKRMYSPWPTLLSLYGMDHFTVQRQRVEKREHVGILFDKRFKRKGMLCFRLDDWGVDNE